MPKPHVQLDSIPPGWINKDEAMRHLGRSRKIFEGIVSEHELEKKYLKRPGLRPIVLFKREQIEELKRPVPVANKTSLEVMRENLGKKVERLLKTQPEPAPAAPRPEPLQLNGEHTTAISADRKHLLTMREAQALGWPRELLKQLKSKENPPGVRYGKRSFKFSAELLRGLNG